MNTIDIVLPEYKRATLNISIRDIDKEFFYSLYSRKKVILYSDRCRVEYGMYYSGFRIEERDNALQKYKAVDEYNCRHGARGRTPYEAAVEWARLIHTRKNFCISILSTCQPEVINKTPLLKEIQDAFDFINMFFT